MVELKGKQLLVSTIISLLIMGSLGYNALPEAYCPLEDKYVRYVHLSESRKTATKVIPEGESWKILDDRCQKGQEIGQWIPINRELIKTCPECQTCEVCPVDTTPYEFCNTCCDEEYCSDDYIECKKDCPIVSCPSYSCDGSSCQCDPCVQQLECDDVDVIAYTDNGKYFCDKIGIDATCIKDETLDMPFFD